MFGIRYIPNKKFLRLLSGNNFLTDGDLETNSSNLLVLPDLWTATQWAENKLKGQPVEIVELAIREIRTIPPVIDVEIVSDEISGDELPKLKGI
jgi:hypothetical protein